MIASLEDPNPSEFRSFLESVIASVGYSGIRKVKLLICMSLVIF